MQDREKHPRIDLWFGRLTGNEQRCADLQRLLDTEQRGRAEQFKTSALRNRYFESWGVVREILADYLSAAPETLRFARQQYGKPYLPDCPELCFNLSHSGGHMLVAVAWRCQLGVDIEQIKSRGHFPGLVNKCFAGAEIAWWQALPDSEKVPAFFRLWTRKEAFVKATGRGIALGMQHVETVPETPGGFVQIPEHYGKPEHWRLVDLDFREDLSGALVVKGEQPTCSWHAFA